MTDRARHLASVIPLTLPAMVAYCSHPSAPFNHMAFVFLVP
jgi:hypothetical protein